MQFIEMCDAILARLPKEDRERLGPSISAIKQSSLFCAPEAQQGVWVRMTYILESQLDLRAEYTPDIIELWQKGLSTLHAERKAQRGNA